MGGGKGRNRLGDASSPYLRQHRDNPVHWWPWGEQSLSEARATDKPILLSIGYAACHWCHVMAHESFEDPETAAVMNELFVNIKVDREERPDIDQIYMAALHALGEPGGWPLTMFLTPAAEPFWGGTYFPPTARFGRPGFPDVLRLVAKIFREEPLKIEQNRAALRQHLDQPPRAGEAALGRQELDAAARGLASILDPVKGGVKGAPKFPNAAVLEAVWRGGERLADPSLAALVLTALDKICRGGIRDHVGGGFARYTVDEAWLVPHFEKMLYDNAQILDLLTLAIGATGEPIFVQAAEELVEFVLRDMRTGEGAFASSFDADSEGEEGRYYVWTPDGVASVLAPEDAAFACRQFDIAEGGNWEGVSIPNRLATRPLDDARWQPIRRTLLAARQERVPPGRDDKVLADWNGMMIAALAHAGRVLGRRDWIDAARAAFRFVCESLGRGDRLGHAWRDGRCTFPGFSADHAQMIRAALRLHECDGDPAWLDRAKRWAGAVERHHSDLETGGYALSADDAADLILRPRSTLDEATPNPNAVMADNLLRLAVLTGEDRWRQRADRLLAGLSGEMAAGLFGHAALFNALDLRLAGAEIVVTGEGSDANRLADAALALPVLSRTVVRAATADALPPGHPARSNWAAGPGRAVVCLGERCSLPAATPEALAERYREMRSRG